MVSKKNCKEEVGCFSVCKLADDPNCELRSQRKSGSMMVVMEEENRGSGDVKENKKRSQQS